MVISMGANHAKNGRSAHLSKKWFVHSFGVYKGVQGLTFIHNRMTFINCINNIFGYSIVLDYNTNQLYFRRSIVVSHSLWLLLGGTVRISWSQPLCHQCQQRSCSVLIIDSHTLQLLVETSPCSPCSVFIPCLLIPSVHWDVSWFGASVVSTLVNPSQIYLWEVAGSYTLICLFPTVDLLVGHLTELFAHHPFSWVIPVHHHKQLSGTVTDKPWLVRWYLYLEP